MKRLKKLLMIAALACLLAVPLAGCANGNEGGGDKPAREEKTLMVGDSLFDLWKGTCATDLKGLPNLKNIAVGGTSSVYWQRQQKIIQRENPTTIIMCLGTNDIADLHRYGECATMGGDEYEQSLTGTLEMFREIIPDVHIYYLTVNICGENIRWGLKDEIRICNQFMRKYCAERDWVDIIETENAFYTHDDYSLKPSQEYFVADYLHFSEAGYKVLTKIVREGVGLDKPTSTPETPDYKMSNVLFMGDSLFDFWDNIYRDFPEIDMMYDIAIGGTTAEYWLTKWERAVKLNPEKVVIIVGTNDIALGKNGTQAATGDTGIQKMLEFYHEKLPDAKFYLCTINICGEATRWDKREDIRECNRLMREYCGGKDWVTIVETENAFYDGDDYTKKPNKKYFTSDYLHFNDAGYEILGGIIRRALGL